MISLIVIEIMEGVGIRRGSVIGYFPQQIKIVIINYTIKSLAKISYLYEDSMRYLRLKYPADPES